MNRVVAIDTCAIINLMHIESFWLLERLKYSPVTTALVRLEFDLGHDESRDYFYKLLTRARITLIPLHIEDLITIANLPRSRRASDAELSCFVVAQRVGCRAMTDDNNAIKYARNHLGIDTTDVLRLVDLLLESYSACLLGDQDLRSIQQILENNRFRIPTDLVAEGARRRLFTGVNSESS